jgi:hypothetical protein
MKLEYDSSEKIGYLNLFDTSGKKSKSFILGDHGKLMACIYYHPLDKTEYFIVKYGKDGIAEEIKGKQMLFSGKIFENGGFVTDSFSILIFPVHPPKYRSELLILKYEEDGKFSEVAKHTVIKDNVIDFVGVCDSSTGQRKYCIVSKLTSEIDSSHERSDTSCFIVKKK